MRRLADQHRTAVAQLERESLQLKHQLLRGLYSVSPSRHTHVHPPRPLTEPAVCNCCLWNRVISVKYVEHD